MKKQLHKIELVKLAVPTIFLIFLAACSSAPSKPYARDFESNYVVKPISKTASMPDSAWIASHMKGFDPLPGVSEILFTKRLDESSDIVDGYDIGQPDQYYKGFEITPKYRVNKGLEYLLTSLASNYDVFEDDLDGYKISPNDTWIDPRKLNAKLPHLPE